MRERCTSDRTDFSAQRQDNALGRRLQKSGSLLTTVLEQLLKPRIDRLAFECQHSKDALMNSPERPTARGYSSLKVVIPVHAVKSGRT
jgi:hypothetical protein